MATDDTRTIEDIVPGLPPRPKTPEEVEDRRRELLMRRVIEGTDLDSASGCWLWRGAKNDKYGRIRVDGRLELPHRVMAYATHKLRSIRQGGRRLVVMHLCDQPLCCNPSHLDRGGHTLGQYAGCRQQGASKLPETAQDGNTMTIAKAGEKVTKR